jgi:four helix bundle protein
MSYWNLEVRRFARELVIDIHKMTLNKLPKFEMFEEGSQIRRSIKSVRSTIVEGYGRRRYKQEFLRFLCCAIVTNDETIDHQETLFETQSLKDEHLYRNLSSRLDTLGRMLNKFIQSVRREHMSDK